MTGLDDFNLKMPQIWTTLIFKSILSFMVSPVEHENSFTTSEPGLSQLMLRSTDLYNRYVYFGSMQKGVIIFFTLLEDYSTPSHI